MNETAPQHRREFKRRIAAVIAGAGLTSSPNFAAASPARKLKFGHTGITWGNGTDVLGGYCPPGLGYHFAAW